MLCLLGKAYVAIDRMLVTLSQAKGWCKKGCPGKGSSSYLSVQARGLITTHMQVTLR